VAFSPQPLNMKPPFMKRVAPLLAKALGYRVQRRPGAS